MSDLLEKHSDFFITLVLAVCLLAIQAVKRRLVKALDLCVTHHELKEALKNEREECAKIADQYGVHIGNRIRERHS